ncbi:SLIT and NTRK-like protein 5 [Nymphon striatum]|nr:SLIT and NTRK-like protein 5 [Nymphon striatum]
MKVKLNIFLAGPPQSPGGNIIEPLWCALENRVRNRYSPPASLKERELNLLATLVVLSLGGIESEGISENVCPDIFEIQPCECAYDLDGRLLLTCIDSNADLTRKALRDVASRNLSFEVINISGGGITYLNKNFLENIQVNKILLDLYNLKLIHDLAFSGQNALKRIQFLSTQLSFIPTEALRETKALDTYELTFSKTIEVIGEDNFKGMNCSSTIANLNFADNSISSIEKGAFAYLENLQNLILSGNLLNSLNANSFPSQPNQLSFINLRENVFRTVPSDIAAFTTEGLTLDFSGNKIKLIPRAVLFTAVWKNTKLDLSDNNINCYCGLKTVIEETKGSWNQARIKGICETPRNLKNKDLNSLLLEDFSLC